MSFGRETARSWYALDVVVEAPAREAIEYGLMEANALGTETNDDGDKAIVRGYFASAPEIESVKTQLLEALTIYNLLPAAMSDVRVSEVPDRDWLAEWKKGWQPVQVGRFIVAPPWLSVPGAVATGSSGSIASHDPVAIAAGTDTIVIRINPGMAFGTGTHETTRLCLKAIERHYRGGSFFHVGTVDDDTESAALVCANLTAPVIVELLPALIGATCGRLILSGILDSQIEMVESRLIELGVFEFDIDQDGEWIAI